MGDVLMSQPAMRALKEAVPGRKITLLTSSVGASIAPFIPEVDEVIPFDVPWVKAREDRMREGSLQQQLLALTNTLRNRQFDAAVIFTVYSQSPLPTAMLCYLAGINNVLGYCRENPYQLISQWVPDREPLDYIIHEVERQLRLVECVGAVTSDTSLSLKLDEGSQQRVTEKISGILVGAHIQPDEPWLVLHAGVSEEKRRFRHVFRILENVRISLGKSFQNKRRAHPARHDSSHLYVVAPGFRVQSMAEAKQSPFTGVVGSGLRPGSLGSRGRNVDNVTLALALQVRVDGF
jgi:ADP-heptose:LPS heptosyltransferase